MIFHSLYCQKLKRLIVTNISQNMEKQVLSDTHWKHYELWGHLEVIGHHDQCLNMHSLYPSNFTFRYLYKTNENICSQKPIYMSLQSSFIPCRSKLEITQMSIRRTRNKQIVPYSRSGICLAKRRNKRTQTQKNTYRIIPFLWKSRIDKIYNMNLQRKKKSEKFLKK